MLVGMVMGACNARGRRSLRPWLGLGAIALGCASGEAPRAASPAQTQPPPAAPSVVASTAESNPADAAAPVDAAPADPFAGTQFPPPEFKPPYERSAKDGDGKWVRMGNTAFDERAAQEPPVLYRTTVQPHTFSKYVTVTVAAMDLKELSLNLVAGTDDPGVAELPASRPPGLVPQQDQDKLVAVFNGGFKPQHGGWGMMVDGKVLVPPREEGCTIMINADDAVEIRSWPALAGKKDKARAYRQTPPCLLENGEVHPDLIAGNAGIWAGRGADRKTRRRTAIGVDASGRVLFFGMGEEADPKLLAEAMKHAGALHAAQLDINYNWTRFLLFGTADGELQVTSTLIPHMVHRKRGYVHHTQPRDFFYIMRR